MLVFSAPFGHVSTVETMSAARIRGMIDPGVMERAAAAGIVLEERELVAALREQRMDPRSAAQLVEEELAMKLDPDRSVGDVDDTAAAGVGAVGLVGGEDAARKRMGWDSQTTQLEELLNFNSGSPQPQSGAAPAAEAWAEASGAPEPAEPARVDGSTLQEPQRAVSASAEDDPLAGWYWHAREESASRGADDALLAVQQQSQLRQLDADYANQRKKLLHAFQEDGTAREQLRRDFAVEAEQRREIEEQLLAVKAAERAVVVREENDARVEGALRKVTTHSHANIPTTT